MKKWICLALALALVMGCGGCSESPELRVTFFRAGKADAAVIQTKTGVIVIDTGLEKNSGELIQALEDLGISRIDALIISHFDKDHVGGAAALLNRFSVGAVYQSNYPKDSDEYEAYVQALADCGMTARTVSDTVTWTLDGVTVTIDGPAQTEYDKDPSNNSSLIVTVTCGANTVLFAGDAENARIREFLDAYRRPEGNLILKMPYHGHWQSRLPDLLQAVQPDAAVISCSKSEPEADELEQTVALLESLGAQVCLTCNGTVTLTCTADGYTIAQAD